jgi:hypothetical protein
MSGPKVSAYELKLRRIRMLRSNAKESEQLLKGQIAVLAAINKDAASAIEKSLGCTDWDDEIALGEYIESMATADRLIADEKIRIRGEANESFRSKLSAMVGDDTGNIETANEVLAEIAEVALTDAKNAHKLLAALGEPSTVDEHGLVNRLNEVISGSASLDGALRADAERIIAARDQAEAGDIALETLGELGYEVSGEFSTLFVKGGMVHFQKPGWKDYYVRMRVNPEDHYFNLNMVRIGKPDESREQRVNDAEMEHTWCGDYPRLLEELSRHGIASNNTRAIDPGAVAVQTVLADQVPAVANQLKRRKKVQKTYRLVSCFSQ